MLYSVASNTPTWVDMVGMWLPTKITTMAGKRAALLMNE